jgi:small subunit ribosomal protein S8
VEIPISKLKTEICKLLLKYGYIRSYEVMEGRTLRLILKYDLHGNPVIRGLKRVSRPGLRVYASKDKLPRVMGGAGTAIVSSSQGILTDHEARKKGVGGEVLCYVY